MREVSLDSVAYRLSCDACKAPHSTWNAVKPAFRRVPKRFVEARLANADSVLASAAYRLLAENKDGRNRLPDLSGRPAPKARKGKK